MKAFTVIFTFFLMMSQNVFADAKSDVRNMVIKNIDAIVDIIRDKSQTKEVRHLKILKKVDPMIDYRTLGYLSIGPNWKSLNKKQKRQFIKSFKARVNESLLEKLDLYTDEKVIYGDAEILPKKRIGVRTTLVTEDSNIDMFFKFSFNKKTKRWKAFDLEILGVSLYKTYRSQFNNMIKKHKVKGFLEKLEQSGEFKIPTEEKKNQ